MGIVSAIWKNVVVLVRKKEKTMFCTKPAGHTDTCPDVLLLRSSSFSFCEPQPSTAVQAEQPLICQLCGKYDVESEVVARCYESVCLCCLPQFLPSWARLRNVSVTESSLPVKLLHQCSDASQSAVFPFYFEYIRMELLSAPLAIIS